MPNFSYQCCCPGALCDCHVTAYAIGWTGSLTLAGDCDACDPVDSADTFDATVTTDASYAVDVTETCTYASVSVTEVAVLRCDASSAGFDAGLQVEAFLQKNAFGVWTAELRIQRTVDGTPCGSLIFDGNWTAPGGAGGDCPPTGATAWTWAGSDASLSADTCWASGEGTCAFPIAGYSRGEVRVT